MTDKIKVRGGCCIATVGPIKIGDRANAKLGLNEGQADSIEWG